MENENYGVKRDNIWVGLLTNDNIERRIYFTLEDNKVKDLLNGKVYSFEDTSIKFSNTYEIGTLLKYLGFNEKLNYDDILKIDEIFRYGWKFDNASLFGLYKSLNDDKIFYSSIDHRYSKFKSYALGEVNGPIPYSLFNIVLNLSNPWDINNSIEIDLTKERRLKR